MRVIFLMFLLALAHAGSAVNDPEILFPANPQHAGKWQKVEIGVQLPVNLQSAVDAFISGKNAPQRLNPFDPDQLSVEAVFDHYGAADTTHTDYSRTVFGFYYNQFTRDEGRMGDAAWIKRSDPHSFRIRFAPDRTGIWSCTVHIKTAAGTVTAPKVFFTCTGSESKGPIIKNQTADVRGRYLQYTETREMFFATGMNLPWTHLDEMRINSHRIYADWFDKIADNGGNYVQLSMLPFTNGIEWETPGNYAGRMQNAWELDRLIDMAENKKLYVNLLLLIHDEFMLNTGWTHKNNNWKNNAYSRMEIKGAATDQLTFFTDPAAKTAFKKRLRYILSRYGYSVHIPVLELLSEVDNAVPGYDDKGAEGLRKRQAVKSWFTEMKTYIKQDLGYAEKLISASYSQGAQTEDIPNRLFSAADIVLLHFYGRDKFTNYNQRAVDANTMLNNYLTANKPVIFDEMGATVFPSLDRCSDITFHNNLWATAFMGCFGTGQNWWWENALLINGYEKSFRGISRFMQDENFAIKAYENKKWINTNRFKQGTDFEAFYLEATDGTKAIGWIHNTSFWWANLKNVNACISDLVEKNNGSSIDAADNSAYGKDYSKNRATGTPVTKSGYVFKLKMPLGDTEYIIKWYDTVTGEFTGQTQTARTSRSGKIRFEIPDISYPSNAYGALGFKIVRFSK